MPMTKIIVFDTGIGGKIFANHFRQEIPDAQITEIIDSANAPYGSKTPEQIISLTEQALMPCLNDPENLIVIACNTATACAIEHLRAHYPTQTFVGTEPGIKPAANLTKNGQIISLATPATIHSRRYQDLKTKFAPHITIYEPNCRDWATLIDHNALTPEIIFATLSPYQKFQPDTIILGCTHFLAIPPQILTDIFPGATIYSPLPAITKQVKALLQPL